MNKIHDVRNVYLVRHCRPQIRDGHICIGRKDIKLSEKGKWQAKELMNYFLNCDLNYIYSSPLKRAKETAGLPMTTLMLWLKGSRTISLSC